MTKVVGVRCFRLQMLWAFALAIVVLVGAGREAAAFSWDEVADEIGAVLEQAVAFQKAGDVKETKRAVTKAYFGIFEGKKMEAGLRKTLGQSHTFLVERQFGALRKKIDMPPAEFEKVARDLTAQLKKDAKALTAAGVSQEVYDAR